MDKKNKSADRHPANPTMDMLIFKEHTGCITEEERNELAGHREFPHYAYAGYLAGRELNSNITDRERHLLAGFREFPSNPEGGYLAGMEKLGMISAEEKMELDILRAQQNTIDASPGDNMPIPFPQVNAPPIII